MDTSLNPNLLSREFDGTCPALFQIWLIQSWKPKQQSQTSWLFFRGTIQVNNQLKKLKTFDFEEQAILINQATANRCIETGSNEMEF
jgi:hypothetical protein